MEKSEKLEETNARRFYCPIDGLEDAWIELPLIWLGLHAQKRDQTIEQSKKFNSSTLTGFAVAMILLEDWNLPGLPANPEKWNFQELRLDLINWVGDVVLVDFGKTFLIKKKQFAHLSSGLKKNTENQDGS